MLAVDGFDIRKVQTDFQTNRNISIPLFCYLNGTNVALSFHMKNKNNKNQKPFSQPFMFDLRMPQGWEHFKMTAPPYVYASLLQSIMSCSCCSPEEKEIARKHFEKILQ